MDILIAGCGTNQAAVFAFMNRAARVVGIDVSEASLAHETHLKARYNLTNLELLRLPIEEVTNLGRDFDLIISTGVLHHMNDPLQGLKALATCLRADGVVGIMLYAKYGRVGVEALQSVFRSLGLHQDEQSVNVVRETLKLLAPAHLFQPYFKIAPDLQFDAGLVDTFLHGRDRSYSVPDCLDFVASAGLVFQGWFNNDCYYPEIFTPLDGAVYSALNRLPEPELWSAVERLQTQNACHLFMACRPDRPRSHYAIDFGTRDYLEYVPELRHTVRFENDAIVRLQWRFPLTPAQACFFREVDGRSTISRMVERVVAAGVLPSVAEAEGFARNLFRSVWRLGLIAFNLKHVSTTVE